MESKQRILQENPRKSANPLSVLFFWWTKKIFHKGYSKPLDIEDIFEPLTEDESKTLGDRLEIKWENQLKKKSRSLKWAVFLTFAHEIITLGILLAVELVCRVMQPILLGRLLQCFRSDSFTSGEDRSEALYYGLGMIAFELISVLLFSQHLLYGYHLGMKMRVATCSLIYRKSLKLSRLALGNTAPGKIVNLLSNDVSRFDFLSLLMHYLWLGPLISVIVSYLLWQEVGVPGLYGLIIVFAVVPVQAYAGKLSSIFRYKTAIRTDERVRFMDEIISGIQVIKMYAWEIPFATLISTARKLEVKIIRKNSHYRALYMTFVLFTTRTSVFITMLTMALSSVEITAAKIFSVTSLYQVATQFMAQMFVRAVAELAESMVAFRRLQEFLEYEEKKDADENLMKNVTNGIKIETIKNLKTEKSTIIGYLKNIKAEWRTSPPSVKSSAKQNKILNSTIRRISMSTMEKNIVIAKEEENHLTLNNVSLEIKQGTLIGVIGHIGAGKSSLLQVILGELPIMAGDINLKGKLSYASQEPWVFGATVRQNILFGQEMRKHRYDAVVKHCALLSDFGQFPEGDRTLIGERGASLSGGQKARINLARAIYREADIYLLDDPLSAVDAHVGKHLFDKVIGPHGYLARHSATRILVTHQIHFLKDAEWIIILDEGKLVGQGTPKKLASAGLDFSELLNEDSEAETIMQRAGYQRHISRTISRISNNSSISSVTDDFIDYLSGEDEEKAKELEKSSKGTVKGNMFIAYVRNAGHWLIITCLIALFVGVQILGSVADYWVSLWTAQEERRSHYFLNESVPISNSFEEESADLLSTETCMWVHGTLIVLILILGITRSIGFYGRCMKASLNLHDKMFKGVVSAAMHFFDVNPSGRILNRFSKDMGAIDELLPKSTLDTAQSLLNMTGIIIITVVVRPVFLSAILSVGLLFNLVRKIYLRTSKNIKRLEGTAKSPVFTHISATLTGLATVRAFGAEGVLIKEFDSHQDLHSGCWYMFLGTSATFTFSLQCIGVILLASVLIYFTIIDSNTTGDQAGLAITQIMSLAGVLQWGIRQSAEVSNHLMAVERVLEYAKNEPEKQPEEPLKLEKNWIKQGRIEFKNVFYRYHDHAEPVLSNISLVILPKEKIGIVGRTGAGKSSLIGTLFRLAKVEGEILIDDINTGKVALSQLRSNISIIPQDPVLFSGTIRRNLDPFEEYPDVNLWNALGAVELKEIAGGPLGLQSPVLAGGSNFSVGQRQLICLARAILRKNKILILDEATANVDPHTDNLIQLTIREKFSECTVLTIAHRLNTIMDSDRVLVMNVGVMAEFDVPYLLLQNHKSSFYDMVKATGPIESERLYQLAKTKYDSIIKSS